MTTKIKFPPKTKGLFTPGYRFYVLYGGRASGKSWAAARALILFALEKKIRVLCIREFMSSISSSVHKLLTDQITNLNLEKYFDTTNNRITSVNGSEFIFAGIKNDPSKVKSTEGIDIAFIEEAETISETSWQILIPTIRKPDSRFIICFNPREENEPTYQRFIVNTPPRTWKQEINYVDNPYCPEVMLEEAEYQKEIDYEMYEHIWLGKPLKLSNSVIFKNRFEVREFDEPQGIQLHYGLDFGYSNDPMAAVRCFTREDELYIDYAEIKQGIELDEYPKVFNNIPLIKRNPIYADAANPGNISLIKRQGYMIQPAKKWAGSVEDGLSHLKSYRKIIIHPRCVDLIHEFENYSWKINKMTEEILAIPEDKNNHGIDALRYALHKEILASGTSMKQWASLGNKSG